MDIAELLAKEMAIAGIDTAYDMAKRSGVPQPTVTRILNGDSKEPKNATLSNLAEGLGIPSSRLSLDVVNESPDTYHVKNIDKRLIYLSKNVRWLAKQDNLPTNKLAKSCGIDQSEVEKIYNCDASVKNKTVEKIADKFGLGSWALYIPDAPKYLTEETDFHTVSKAFSSTDDEGKALFLAVAKRELSRKSS